MAKLADIITDLELRHQFGAIEEEVSEANLRISKSPGTVIEAAMRNVKGQVDYSQDNYSGARGQYEKALVLALNLGGKNAQIQQAVSHANLSSVCLAENDVGLALDHANEAVSLAPPYTTWSARAFLKLGYAQRGTKPTRAKHEISLQSFKSARRHLDRASGNEYQLLRLNETILDEITTGYIAARKYAKAISKLMGQIEDNKLLNPNMAGCAVLNLSRVSSAKQEFWEAQDIARHAEQIFEATGYARGYSMAILCRAEAYLNDGDKMGAGLAYSVLLRNNFLDSSDNRRHAETLERLESVTRI